MTRIEKTFEKLAAANEKALVGFVTAGDPDPARSMDIIFSMIENGVDILELGVPFSDPTADGPVIQRSSARALKKGMNLEKVCGMVGAIRKKFADVPVIVFSYYNPIYAYGIEKFYRDFVSAGADGVLVVDLPAEESEEMTGQWTGDPLPLIRLVAPTTPDDRMKRIARVSEGFIYMVSKTGVTGSDGLDAAESSGQVERLKEMTRLPVCVGFGISTPSDVAQVARVADGVVIGSAFERTIEENLEDPTLAKRLGQQTADYKAATRMK
ncbi:MAG: tryptophan synthase subunit alpha [Desulfosalsimonadaceae bacterium]